MAKKKIVKIRKIESEYKKNNRNPHLLGSVVGTLIGVATLGASYFFYQNKASPQITPAYNLSQVGLPSLMKESLERFDILTPESQESILSDLERFVISNTVTGRLAKSIIEYTPVENVEDPSLPLGQLRYRSGTYKIHYRKVPHRSSFEAYLYGSPYIFGRAHEVLHHIQAISSKWDKFESYFKDFIMHVEKDNMEVFTELREVPTPLLVSFAQKWYNNPRLDLEHAKEKVQQLLNEYNATHSDRHLIREMQAYLALQYFSSDTLYQKLLKDTGIGRWSFKVDKPKFDHAFNATLELLAISGPKDAARFVGHNGDNVDNYLGAVETLKSQVGGINALDRGKEQQTTFLRESVKISDEAIRYLSYR